MDVVLGADLREKYKHQGGPLVQDRLLPEYDFGYHPRARKEYEETFGVDPKARGWLCHPGGRT